MLVLYYDPENGEVVPDGKIETYVDRLIACGRVANFHVKIGSETILDMFRLKIAQNELDIKDVIFMWNGDIFEVNEFGVFGRYVDGKSGNPPPSFGCDLAGKIIKTSIAKRKAKIAKDLLDRSSLQEATI